MGALARVAIGLFVVAVGGATLVAQAVPVPATPQTSEHGASLYATYCATCHGRSARGDGPLADSMRRRPPDLTDILERNKGVFPKELIFRIIDGRQPVRGHGGPDMPVWGDAFRRSTGIDSERAVRDRIQAIVDYLETIQLRSGR
jgi:mono/diheme cytochrome c family protein